MPSPRQGGRSSPLSLWERAGGEGRRLASARNDRRDDRPAAGEGAGLVQDDGVDAVCALETNTNAYDVIEFLPGHELECLARDEVAKANPGILKTYAIPSDRRL